MRINFKQLYRAFKLNKNSGQLGDFAILKADALGAKVNPTIAAQLESVVGYYPAIELEKLSHYPPGTFGREYADHLIDNQLKPFNVSPELDEIAQRNVFALRYAVTHDIFHVLLGFDTTYAGEIGVLAFAATQNYSPALKVSFVLAKLLYPLLAPRQTSQIFANASRGQALAMNAKFLLGVKFEEWWDKPLDEVRESLGLSID